MGREQGFELVPEPRDLPFRIRKMLVGGGVQHRDEAAQRVAGRRDDGLVVAAIQLEGQRRREEAEAFFEAALERPARSRAHASKGTTPGATAFMPSGSTGYSPVKQA